MTLSELFSRARDILQDGGPVANRRWRNAELLRWVNESYVQIANARPDVTAALEDIPLTAGDARQTLPDGARRLISIVSNWEPDKEGRAIRSTTFEALDSIRPDWREDDDVDGLEYYIYDPRVPKEFWVYPKPKAGRKVWAVVAKAVTPHPSSTVNDSDELVSDANTGVPSIRIDPQYGPAILDWVLYRCWSKDAEDMAAQNRAAGSLAAFNGAVGEKTDSDAAFTPVAVAGLVKNLLASRQVEEG